MRKQRIKQPQATGDAAARYERLSHSGTTWYDLSSLPADGTDGTTGAAFTWPNFNGESFVSIGDPTKLQFAGAFTICAWYNQSTDPPTQGNERILSRDNVHVRPFLLSQGDNTGFAQAYVSAPVFSNVAATGTYASGTFHFMVVVNEGVGGDLLIYIDGELKGTTAGAGGAVANWGTFDTEFGRHQFGGGLPDDYFTGIIDTGRFYGRALSPDEILRDYNAGKPAHP